MGNINNQPTNSHVPAETRAAFRDWMKAQLRAQEFYNRRGDHYLIREFAKYCAESGHPIDEASLGRYIRDENPVIPTPARCRDLAAVFQVRPFDVMKIAGLLRESDLSVPTDDNDEEGDDAAEKGA